MSEKKNKVNVQAAVISAIVILALAGGGLFGYMYYNNVYLPAEYEKKYAIEDVDYPVETRVIYEGGWESTYKENVEAVADAMENSDAMFFLQEGGAGVSDEVLINRVWQTDKSNYEATSGMEAKNAKEIFIEDAAAFLNTNYRKIPDKTTYYIGNMFRHQTNNIFRQDRRFPCVDWEEDEYFEEKYEVFYGRKQNQSHADRRRGQRKTTGKCNRKQEAQTDSKCPDPVVLYSRPGDGVRGIRYK